MSECQLFFEKNSGKLDIVPMLCGEVNRFDWELECASKHSPGPVISESLCRHIQEPLYYNPQTASLTPDAFNDAFDKGLSTDRVVHTTDEAIISRGRQRDDDYRKKSPDKPPRTLVALAYFDADEVRAFRSLCENQSFGIFDTADQLNQSHADVCSLVLGNQERRRARAHLDKIVKLKKLDC